MKVKIFDIKFYYKTGITTDEIKQAIIKVKKVPAFMHALIVVEERKKK